MSVVTIIDEKITVPGDDTAAGGFRSEISFDTRYGLRLVVAGEQHRAASSFFRNPEEAEEFFKAALHLVRMQKEQAE